MSIIIFCVVSHAAALEQSATDARVNLTAAEYAWIKSHNPIRVGISPVFPPLKFIENTEIKGIEPDYLKLLSEYTGIKFKMVVADLPSMDAKVKSGELDMFISFYIPERLSFMSFTEPLFEFKQVFVSRNDATFISGIGTLKGKKIATVKGVKLYEKLLAPYPDVVKVPVDTMEQMFQAVAESKADVLISKTYYAGYVINKYPNLKIAGVADLSPEPYLYAVRKDYPELVSILNKTIISIPNDRREAITQKWFNVRIEYKPNWQETIKWVIGTGVVFTVILGITLYWNRRLRTEIALRHVAENTQKEREEQFRALSDASFGGVIIHEKGLILECNKALSDLTGFTHEELIGMNGLDLIAPECLDTVLANIKSGYELGYEVVGVRKDGSKYQLAIRGKNTVYKGRDVRVIEFRDVTELNQAIDSLKKNEARQRAMIENIVDVIAIIDQDGTNRFKSSNITKHFGWQVDEVVGLPAWSNIHPDDLKETQAVFTGLFAEPGLSNTSECRYLCKDGSYKWIEYTAVNMLDNPNIDGVLLNYHDITGRRHSENLLKTSEELFRSFVENANDIVFSISAQGIFTYVSPKWKEALGYETFDAIGKPFAPFAHPDDVDRCFGFLTLVLESGIKQEDFEFRVRHKDGKWVWFSANASRMYNSESNEVYFLGIGRDISERIQARKQLIERQGLLDALLANLPVGVFMVEVPSGKPLIANEKAMVLLGRGILPDTSKENLTEVYEAYKYGTNERYPVEEMPIVRGMYGESVKVDDLLVVRPDGTNRLLEIAGAPVLDENGAPWASLVCFQDISDRKVRELEQLKMDKLESLGFLAGGIAHDFNNILTGIMGNISFAQMFIDPAHKAFKPIVEAEKASVRATELAHQLLTFARGGDPVKKVVLLRHIVSEAMALVLHGSNVRGLMDFPETTHAIEADEGQMSQVFHNIVINATQAMPGGGTLKVSAQNTLLAEHNPMSLPAGTYVCLKFTDEGCGISESTQKRIFDPYFTTKSAGNGLGLASAHSIISKHGGHISVSSIVGKGTTFTIHLPSIGETYIDYQAENNIPMTVKHNGGSVLIMDDEKVIRDLASEMLEYLGYQVSLCDNGADAVAIYKTAMNAGTPFAAVVMDLTIPGGMGGKEAAQQILAIDPGACLIVSSGYSNDPIMADFSRYGFSGVIAKPYSVKDFGHMLSSLIPSQT